MGSIQNTVYYCCVARGNNILYGYNDGDHEMNGLALLCLENTPPFHKWYSETTGNKTFAYLIDGGYVYFAIADENVGNSEVLQFLEHLRDEFTKALKKGSRGSLLSINSFSGQEHLLPVIRHLIASFEKDAQRGSAWKSGTSSANVQLEGTSSTKAPLLGKSSKQEKKKAQEHVIVMREIGLGEHRKSTDRGATSDSVSATLDSSDQSGVDSSVPMRIRSATPSFRKKWCRQVRIVLAIDAAICFVLFVIWLCVCRGIECVR